MPTSYTLEEDLEAFVQSQLASGRYSGAGEVLRDALLLMEERERRMADLDGAVERGMADVRTGRVRDVDGVFDRLEDRYARMDQESSDL